MAFTLNNMSVPTYEGDSSTLLMPKLSYRFRVVFDNFGVSASKSALTQQVVDFTRPQVNFPEIALPVYNSTIYIAGKPAWQPVTLTIRDDATAAVTKLVGEQLQKQFDFAEQASASSGVDYKFKLLCQMLDGGRGADTVNILEAWELHGCYIADANYNQLNYANSEAMQITLQIRFDNAVQTPQLASDGPAVGIGEAIGRTLGSLATGSAASPSA